MEPLPETVEAVRSLSEWGDDPGLLDGLLRLAERAREVVPDLVGVSLSRLDAGLTFTVVASTEQVALWDGVQYLGDGPCVEGAHSGELQTFEAADPLDEDHWRYFSEHMAPEAVRSTLTLPLVLPEAAGSVNLYAASDRAFVDHHEAMAIIFGSWAGAAVTNADLAFSTLQLARAAPKRIRDLTTINETVGLLAARFDEDIDAAEHRLREAAARAGVPNLQLAKFLIDHNEQQSLQKPRQPNEDT